MPAWRGYRPKDAVELVCVRLSNYRAEATAYLSFMKRGSDDPKASGAPGRTVRACKGTEGRESLGFLVLGVTLSARDPYMY